MPGLVTHQWTVDGQVQPPSSAAYEHDLVDSVAAECTITILGETHTVRFVATFDPMLRPLDLADQPDSDGL